MYCCCVLLMFTGVHQYCSYCSSILFINTVHQYCSSILFINTVHQYCSSILFILFINIVHQYSSSILVFIDTVHQYCPSVLVFINTVHQYYTALNTVALIQNTGTLTLTCFPPSSVLFHPWTPPTPVHYGRCLVLLVLYVMVPICVLLPLSYTKVSSSCSAVSTFSIFSTCSICSLCSICAPLLLFHSKHPSTEIFFVFFSARGGRGPHQHRGHQRDRHLRLRLPRGVFPLLHCPSGKKHTRSACSIRCSPLAAHFPIDQLMGAVIFCFASVLVGDSQTR